MNSITFIFSNEIQEIFDGSLNENLRFSKTISMNADDGILNNRWEIIGTKHMISLNNFVNNIIDLQKENKLEKIKIKQIEYYIYDEQSGNLNTYQLNILLNV